MRTIFITLALLIATPASSFAQGIPVIDTTSLQQELLQAARLLEQIEQARQAYETQIEELQAAIEANDLQSGVSGIGQLLNTNADRDLRRYLPGSWEETLAILAAGGNPGSLADVERVYREYEQGYRVLEAGTIGAAGPDDPTSVAYERNRQSAWAGGAVAEAAYERAQTRVPQYEVLMDQIEQTQSSKQAMDLANRVSAENGLTTNELVRLSAAQLAAWAAMQAEQNQAREKVEKRLEGDMREELLALEQRLRAGGTQLAQGE